MSNEDAGSKAKVVIVSHYYAPDISATGQILHSLGKELAARGFVVAALTALPSYGPPELRPTAPHRDVLDGVRVLRVRSTRFSKDRLAGRLLNILTFIAQVTRHVLFGPSDRVYLYVTNPPFLPMVGAFVSLLRRHRYVVLLHDSYPQVAVWVGAIKRGSMIERIWHRLNRITYRRAAQTIVLCEKARDLVCDTYGIDRAHVHEVHNWADGEFLRPKPKAESRFAREHGLIDPFVVMYSGNLGLFYDFETILLAAEKLRGENFRLVLIGAGGRAEWIREQTESRGLTNVDLLPYQPKETIPDSLAGCDVSLVSIADGIEGISFPSKLYSSLAMGKPILAVCEAESQLRRLVEDNDAGAWAPAGDAEQTAQTIRGMMKEPEVCTRQGQHARQLFESRFAIQHCVDGYERVLRLALGDEAAKR